MPAKHRLPHLSPALLSEARIYGPSSTFLPAIKVFALPTKNSPSRNVVTLYYRPRVNRSRGRCAVFAQARPPPPLLARYVPANELSSFRRNWDALIPLAGLSSLALRVSLRTHDAMHTLLRNNAANKVRAPQLRGRTKCQRHARSNNK